MREEHGGEEGQGRAVKEVERQCRWGGRRGQAEEGLHGQ